MSGFLLSVLSVRSCAADAIHTNRAELALVSLSMGPTRLARTAVRMLRLPARSRKEAFPSLLNVEKVLRELKYYAADSKHLVQINAQWNSG